MDESGLNDCTGELDTDSEKRQDASLEKLSILERLGLKSTLEMNEDEVESAFIRFAVGFDCNQYTLTQRLQAELHNRMLAEENLQKELHHTRETLQVLYDRLAEVDSRGMVLQMENRLQMIESNMEDVITRAEMLGAAHQEARVSHAADLMSIHIEHLKRRHTADSEELLEVRKLLHRRKGRLHSDSNDDRDASFRQSQQSTRRRVSITLLPTPAEMMDIETVRSEEESETRSHARADRRQEVARLDSSEGGLTFNPSDPFVLDSALNQNDDDDDENAVFPCQMQVTGLCRQRRSAPFVDSVKGVESERGEEPVRGGALSLKCLASHQRPLLAWSVTILSVIFCIIILMTLWLTAPVMRC